MAPIFAPTAKLHEHTCECCRTALDVDHEGPVAIWRNIFGTNTRDFAMSNLDKGGVRRATPMTIGGLMHARTMGLASRPTAGASSILSGLPMEPRVRACSTSVLTGIGNQGRYR